MPDSTQAYAPRPSRVPATKHPLLHTCVNSPYNEPRGRAV